ncbi:MAG: protease complex subunit PrcB family protein [Actinomycetota bacterium]
MRGSSPVTRRLAAFLLMIILVTSTVALFAGCGEQKPPGDEGGEAARTRRDIPLKTLAQGLICEYGRFEPSTNGGETGPSFLVLTNDEELKRLLSLSGLEITAGEVDLSRWVVVAAFQGPRATAGYAISMIHAVQEGTEVRVDVELVEPEPGSMTAQVLTSPYHLVLAERDDFDPRGEVIFIFMDQRGEMLERISAEI